MLSGEASRNQKHMPGQPSVRPSVPASSPRAAHPQSQDGTQMAGICWAFLPPFCIRDTILCQPFITLLGLLASSSWRLITLHPALSGEDGSSEPSARAAPREGRTQASRVQGMNQRHTAPATVSPAPPEHWATDLTSLPPGGRRWASSETPSSRAVGTAARPRSPHAAARPRPPDPATLLVLPLCGGRPAGQPSLEGCLEEGLLRWALEEEWALPGWDLKCQSVLHVASLSAAQGWPCPGGGPPFGGPQGQASVGGIHARLDLPRAAPLGALPAPGASSPARS